MKLLPYLGYLFLRGLHATLRVRHVNAEHIQQTPQYVVAFWHAHLLLMLHSRFVRPITVMSSRSRDGDLMVAVYALYGVESVRGSSTRGGTGAMRGMIRKAREGRSIVFTPDGPKGPPRVAKDGVVYAAKMTGLPIVPIAFAAQKKNFSAPGTGWSCRCRSRRRSSCTARRLPCRVTATSRSGG